MITKRFFLFFYCFEETFSQVIMHILVAGYAWLKCEREEDKDCYAVLEEANIMGRRGSVFGAEERYVRLSLVRSQDDFDLMIHQLNKLVSQEYNPKLILEPGTFVSES